MQFEEKKGMERLGQMVGFACSYLLSSVILFFAVAFTTASYSWTLLHSMGIVLIVVFIGFGLRRALR